MIATEIPSVSVVIPTFGRRDGLARVIRPLLNDTAVTEIVVVVDGGADGSIELLEEMAAQDGRLRPVLIDNRGESGARLEGVRRASGEVVLLLDDDVEAAPGLASAHVRHHIGREDLLVAGYMPVANPVDAPSRLYSESYENHVDRWRAGQSVIGSLWSGNVSLRRSSYLEVSGRPAPERYDFHADRVFGLTCEAAGLTGIFDPACCARHHYERSLQGLARDARRQGEALIRMQREFAGLAPPVRPDAFTWYLPPALTAVVDLARRPRFDRLARRIARDTTVVTERFGRNATAVKTADLLAILERQRGAIDASCSEAAGA